MKLHWGYSILVFFIFYISFLAFTVYKSTQVDRSLVVEDYYAHDLSYQKRYDAIKNRQLLNQDLEIKYVHAENNVVLDFGKYDGNVKGVVDFYRPSNKRIDNQHAFDLDGAQNHSISAENLSQGKWIVKVEWADELRKYYKEEEIFLIHS